MERAEKLKGVEKKKAEISSSPAKTSTSGATASRPIPPLGFDLLNLRDDPGSEGGGSGPSKGGLSEEEKKVLTVTSKINGREYVPFLSVDLRWVQTCFREITF